MAAIAALMSNKCPRAINPKYSRIKTAHSCVATHAIVPSTDFFVPGHLCIPKIEPTPLAAASPMPIVMIPLASGNR